jgi:Carboxypeptidase regulatory-like domain
MRHAVFSGFSSALRRRCVLGGCLVSLTAAGPALQAQRSDLIGFVRDERGQPVADARISVRGTKTQLVSDADGRFAAPALPHGLTVVTAQRGGAFPAAELLNFGPTDTLNFVLTAVGLRDDSVTAIRDAEQVYKRLVDRYSRATSASRSAKAFTERDIQRRAPAVTSDLLVGVVGFTVAGGGSGAQVYSVRDGCEPTIWIDEVERVNFALNEIRPTMIKIMLAWNGYAVIPASLRSTRVEPSCGAISILTR